MSCARDAEAGVRSLGCGARIGGASHRATAVFVSDYRTCSIKGHSGKNKNLTDRIGSSETEMVVDGRTFQGGLGLVERSVGARLCSGRQLATMVACDASKNSDVTWVWWCGRRRASWRQLLQTTGIGAFCLQQWRLRRGISAAWGHDLTRNERGTREGIWGYL